MANRPSTPEVITVNSESLQSAVRDLLPSQNGFGSELQASNVITPIIDLTPTAEGSTLPTYLQTALAFGSNTNFDLTNGTVTAAASAGFYRITGAVGQQPTSSSSTNCFIQIDDGSTQVNVWESRALNVSGSQMSHMNVDYTVWLRPGDSLILGANGSGATFGGSVRQVATTDGTLVQPSGFPS